MRKPRDLRTRKRLSKHHQRIAEVISTQPNEDDKFLLASLFSSAFKRDDSRFNIDRFMGEAGIVGWWQAW